MAARGRALLLVAALLSLAVFLTAPRAHAQDEAAPDLPDSFAGAARSEALGFALLTPALVPVEGLFEFGVVEGRGTYEAANQEGRASVFFPGQGGIQGPLLLCGTFIGPQIPPEGDAFFGPIIDACTSFHFPLAVLVDSLNPDDQTEGAVALGAPTDPVSLGAAGARAHAGIDAMTTEAEVSDFDVLGLPSIGGLQSLFDLLGQEGPDTSLVRADGLTARTDQRITDGALVTDSEATVSGLRFLGGLVRIESVVSHSRITSAPGQDPVIDTSLDVSGVTVGGQPAQITEDGLVVGSGAASGPLAQQLSSAVADQLQDTGFRISTLAEEEGETNGIPYAGVGGLLVEFSTPLAGLPPIPVPEVGDLDFNGSYGVRIQIGTTGVRGFADDFTPAPPITRPPATAGGSSGGGTSSGGGGGGTGSSGGTGITTPSTAPPTTVTAVDEPEEASFIDDLFADRLGFLYLSFTLTAIALCLAPRLSLPARLPAARS